MKLHPKYVAILRSPRLSGMAKAVFLTMITEKGATPNTMASELNVGIEVIVTALQELHSWGLIRGPNLSQVLPFEARRKRKGAVTSDEAS